MPSTRYSFSAHTQRDWDVIEWLDSFLDPRERTLAIKAAIRVYMGDEQVAEVPNIDSIKVLQDQISETYRAVVDLKNALASREYHVPQKVQSEQEGKAEIDMNDPDIQEATNNLLELLKD